MKEQSDKTDKTIWDPEKAELSAAGMICRIEGTIKLRAWRHVMGVVARSGTAMDKLRVAEVGCGTGTSALIFCLLGASVTLIDSNRRVLDRTRKMFDKFGCRARFISDDCLEPVTEGLAGAFDVVISGGLAEHFTGIYRKKCFDYHGALLKSGGLVLIAAPNRLSPFYQWVRRFRILTGTWGLDVEVPFSNREMRSLAEGSGFKNCYVLGMSSLPKDLIVYSRGFLSAVVDLLPKTFKEPLRKIKAEMADKGSSSLDPRTCAEKSCREAFRLVETEILGDSRSIASDWLSSGLILIGFK